MLKPLDWLAFIRHDGTVALEVRSTNGYIVHTAVYDFGKGHEGGLAMFKVSEKLRAVANDAMRDAPRPKAGS